MTSEEILALKRPEQLFSGEDEAATKKEYFALAKVWHPDIAPHIPKVAEVFAHINKLHKSAVEKIKEGCWGYAGVRSMKTNGGTMLRIKYHSEHHFELGTYYIGDLHVTYVFDAKHLEFVERVTSMTQKFRFDSDKMAKELSPCLPDPANVFRIPSTKAHPEYYVVAVPKPKNYLLLRDVLNFYDGAIDPRHVAWICSRLHNISCYLHWAKLTHNEISPDTVFIDPVDHKAALLGGWWYAMPAGKALKHVSKRTHNVLPWKVKVEKRASRKTDLELIKRTGLDLLGKNTTLAPKAMVDCFGAVATKNAFIEYKDWGDILVKSFGARRFTVMELTPEQLYPKR